MAMQVSGNWLHREHALDACDIVGLWKKGSYKKVHVASSRTNLDCVSSSSLIIFFLIAIKWHQEHALLP